MSMAPVRRPLVVDAQVHGNLVGPPAALLAAMDAAGVDAVVSDEWGGTDPEGRRRPNRVVADGVVGYPSPAARGAVQARPDRIMRTAWIGHRASRLTERVAALADDAQVRALRLVVRADSDDLDDLRHGRLDTLFRALESNSLPLVFCLSRVRLDEREGLLGAIASAFPRLPLVLDHCGVLPLADRDIGLARDPSALLARGGT
jgi:predicted TIM-barrel fold metal-dependent hydrolase